MDKKKLNEVILNVGGEGVPGIDAISHAVIDEAKVLQTLSAEELGKKVVEYGLAHTKAKLLGKIAARLLREQTQDSLPLTLAKLGVLGPEIKTAVEEAVANG